MELVRGAGDAWELELDAISTSMNMATVDFGLFFAAKACPDGLKKALAQILPSFSPVAGRLVKRGDKVVVNCNDAGVPFTYVIHDDAAAPSLATPLSDDLFDFVRNWVPMDDGVEADAVLRIKVTDFADKQVIAISCTHGLADARSLGTFVSAWCASFRGIELATAVMHDRSQIPPSPAFGQAPLMSSDGISEDWIALHPAPTGPPGEPYEPFLSIYERSAEICQQMKSSRSAEVPITTNDVILGEIAEALDASRVGVAWEFREALGVPNLFGVAVSTLVLQASTPISFPVEFRKALPAIHKADFVKWKVAQGMTPAKVVINSWVRAFKLSDIHFESAAEGMMISKAQWSARAKMFPKMGMRYSITLPTRDGFRVMLLAEREAGDKLQATCVGIV